MKELNMKPEEIANLVVLSREKHYAMIIPVDALYLVSKALKERDAQIARMEVELSGADERSKMIFEAKNHWADRARKAEAKLPAQEAVAELKNNNGRVTVNCLSEIPPGVTSVYFRAAPPALVVPDGWRMVPIEPTDEMLSAGDKFMDGLSELGNAYSAMVEAAPKLEGEHG